MVYACLDRINLTARIGCHLCLITLLVAACIANPRQVSPQPPAAQPGSVTPAADTSGPRFVQITPSSKVFVKSDCMPIAITVTATITAPAGVAGAVLWYRVGDQQPFTPVDAVAAGDDQYVATVKGTDVPGAEYGVWEFYLTAEDRLGKQSQSPLDTSVQFLPCVG